MLRLIHNEKIALYWAVVIEIVVHALFAMQAFLLGSFLGETTMQVVFGEKAGVYGAWALALFVFGAAFCAFVYGEYQREHVESYEGTLKGNGSFIRSFQTARWVVGGLEIGSLLFRCVATIQAGHALQAAIIALVGLLALWYAFLQAKIIHASVNRPIEYDIVRAQDIAGRSVITDAIRQMPRMTPQQKTRFAGGDASVVEETYASGLQARQAKLQPKKEQQEKDRARIQAAHEKMERAGRLRDRFFGKPEPDIHELPLYTAQGQQATGETLSHNGYH